MFVNITVSRWELKINYSYGSQRFCFSRNCKICKVVNFTGSRSHTFRTRNFWLREPVKFTTLQISHTFRTRNFCIRKAVVFILRAMACAKYCHQDITLLRKSISQSTLKFDALLNVSFSYCKFHFVLESARREKVIHWTTKIERKSYGIYKTNIESCGHLALVHFIFLENRWWLSTKMTRSHFPLEAEQWLPDNLNWEKYKLTQCDSVGRNKSTQVAILT